ncbi:MAG: PepSY domain-containing protein [Gemmatimonadales bacterium]
MWKPIAALALVAAVSVGAQTRKDTPASLQREARISMATARAKALKVVPTGKVTSEELEREKGKLIYSFDIKVAGKSGIEEVNIDAKTGAVLAHEHETPKMEMKEAAKETKVKK